MFVTKSQVYLASAEQIDAGVGDAIELVPSCAPESATKYKMGN